MVMCIIAVCEQGGEGDVFIRRVLPRRPRRRLPQRL